MLPRANSICRGACPTPVRRRFADLRQPRDEPLVQRPVNLKAQIAKRMRHPLDPVALPVGPVVHRVDVPRVPRARVVGVQNPVHRRVAQHDVRARHVDLRPQHLRPVRKLPRLHPREQVQALLHRPVPKRARRPRHVQVPPVRPDLLRRLVVHVRVPRPNQRARPVVQLIKRVRRVGQRIPVKAQPAHVRLNRIDVRLLLLRRIRVVHPQVGFAPVPIRHPEVDADRLRVPDVQKPVGLRRKARRHVVVAARLKVLVDRLGHEVQGFFGSSFVGVYRLSMTDRFLLQETGADTPFVTPRNG